MVTLPINWDIFTSIVISLLNSYPFQNFTGVLDANGEAAAKFNTLGPLSGLPVTIYITFAYGLSSPWDYASNGATIEVLP